MRFIETFFQKQGIPTKDIIINPLLSDGSSRLFSRLSCSPDYPSFILMQNPPNTEFKKKENIAYLRIGKHLNNKGLPIPEIYEYDLSSGSFLLEDFGDINLQKAVSCTKDRIGLYEKVLEILMRLGFEGAHGFDTNWCCQTTTYDRSVMRQYESDYFRDSFLKNFLGIKSEFPELEPSFEHLATMASEADNHYFLHRDFQSRNIMIKDNRIGILDWQGGRLGPLAYDLASLYSDPYVNLTEKEREQICDQYVSLLRKTKSYSVESFKKYFPYLTIQRNLQILGAYSYLFKVQGKSYFEQFIPPAIKSLFRILDELNDPKLSSLKDLVNDLL
jgi:N-acetylmuramate 1-kinase